MWRYTKRSELFKYGKNIRACGTSLQMYSNCGPGQTARIIPGRTFCFFFIGRITSRCFYMRQVGRPNVEK